MSDAPKPLTAERTWWNTPVTYRTIVFGFLLWKLLDFINAVWWHLP